ncbi:MAG: protein translocase subunit SecD [Pseudomonadota bacterium]
MLYFERWKMIAILGTVLAAFAFAFPNVLNEQTASSLPSPLDQSRLNLGLDLQGGVYLLAEIDEAELTDSRLENLREELCPPLRETRTGCSAMTYTDTGVRIRLSDDEKRNQLKAATEELLLPLQTGVFGQAPIEEIELIEESGFITYNLTRQGLDKRLNDAVEKAIEVIRRRIDALGVSEPQIQRQGVGRIVIQAPGAEDAQELKDTIGEPARMSFHLVSEEADPAAVLQGQRPPRGTEVLNTNDDPPLPVLIQTRELLTGEDLAGATPGFDSRTNQPVVNFTFNSRGGQIFADITQRNVGRPFAIVLDGTVLTAPVINEPILGGAGQISGNFTAESANALAIQISSGALPARLTYLEERTVGPSLGADSIVAGELAGIVGAVLVLTFMFLAYGKLGIIANIALTANIVMILALLSVLGATLTLPGIAGIVLTVGMAVDSNVLIYERIREERRNGRNVIQAIDAGFRRALVTIIDASLTTLLAAVILFYLGSGPIRGFAVTLAIGIVTTVFTAFTLTRLMIAVWVQKTRPKELPKRWISLVKDDTHIPFMPWRKIAFPASAVTVLLSAVMFVTVGLNLGIDFKGGTLFEVQSRAAVADLADVRDRMNELNLGDVQVQEFGTPRDVLIRVEPQEAGSNGEQSVVALVTNVLGEDYEIRRQEAVGPTVSGELARAGTIAVVVALLAILVYIWLRFEWQFALGAIAATTHDVILTIGMFSLVGIEFGLASIAAILTIVGYSLNDTVVVYDRVRENLRRYKKMEIPELLDMSINQMLPRTILTSVTTLLALLALYTLGGEVLASFTFAMIFGVIIGTYSSIFMAAPLLILFNLRPGALSNDDVDAEKRATANTSADLNV